MICRDCGRPVAECSDPTRDHYPFRRVCYVSMNRDAASAAYDTLHDELPWHDGTFTSWAAKRSASHPYRYTFGVTIGVADHDLTPYDKFTTERDASPVPPEVD